MEAKFTSREASNSLGITTRFILYSLGIVFGFAGLSESVAGTLAATQDSNTRHHHHYKLTILPTLGGTFGEAWGVNNSGSIDGHSTLPLDEVYHAFLWRKGVITDLGTLGGPNSNQGFLNDQGEVSGASDTSIPDPNGEDFCGFGTNLICLPFVWQKGVMTPLPLLGGNNGSAAGINNRGQIVGVSETPNSDPCSFSFLQMEAVVWENGTVQELPPFPGDSDGIGSAINDSGQVVGATGCATTNTIRAVLWPHGPTGGVIDLGNLGDTTFNLPFGINNRSQVVGQSITASGFLHGFLWQNGIISDLGSLPGLPTSVANGLNNQGQVVGFSEDANGDDSTAIAWLWQNGVLTDLNTLIRPGSPLFLLEALSINDRGQIAGFGRLANDEHRGFLLIPCDENDPGVEGCDYSLVEHSSANPNQSHTRLSGANVPLLQSINRLNPHLRFGDRGWGSAP